MMIMMMMATLMMMIIIRLSELRGTPVTHTGANRALDRLPRWKSMSLEKVGLWWRGWRWWGWRSWRSWWWWKSMSLVKVTLWFKDILTYHFLESKLTFSSLKIYKTSHNFTVLKQTNIRTLMALGPQADQSWTKKVVSHFCKNKNKKNNMAI